MATVLYRGIAFPVRASSTEFPASSSDADLVQASIAQLLMTQRGERVMRPDVGTVIYSLIFENEGELLAELIRDEVLNAIGRYEPRALILGVRVNRLEQEIEVDVDYALRSTGEPGTVQAFYAMGTP